MHREPTEPRLDDEAQPVLVSADVSILDVSASSEQPSGKHEVADLIQSG